MVAGGHVTTNTHKASGRDRVADIVSNSPSPRYRETHNGINFETTNSTSRDIININDDIRTWQDIWGECDSY